MPSQSPENTGFAENVDNVEYVDENKITDKYGFFLVRKKKVIHKKIRAKNEKILCIMWTTIYQAAFPPLLQYLRRP